MRTPEFLIVGAPKCGTTSLHTYLRAHPRIFLPEVKDVRFWGSDLRLKQPLSEPAYLARFAPASPDELVGDTSCWCLYSSEAATEIQRLCDEVKIIVILRNPVDTLHSLHSQALYNFNENIQSLEQALAAEDERRIGQRVPASALLGAKCLLYRDVVNYPAQLRRYFDVYGRDKVHVVIFEDFCSDTASVYRTTLDFLGIHEPHPIDFKVENSNRVYRSSLLNRLLWRTPRFLLRLRRLLPAGGFGIATRLKRWNTRVVGRAPLGAELRARLTRELAPSVRELSSLLGRDLSGWTEAKPADLPDS